MTQNNSLPRLAVMAGFKPDDISGGPLNIRMLLRNYPGDKVYWLNSKPDANKKLWNNISAYWNSLDTKKSGTFHFYSMVNNFLWYFDIKFLRKIWMSKKYSKIFQNAAEFVLWQVWTRLEAFLAHRFCIIKKVDVCFMVLDWPFIPFAWRFIRRSRLPVHIRVDDDPKSAVQIMNKPWDIADKIDRAFEECYRMSESREVVSEGMRLHYYERFNCDAVVKLPINDTPLKQYNKKKRADISKNLKIIHLGHLRRPELKNLEYFMEALTILREKYSVNVSIDFFGRDIKRYSKIKIPVFASIHGWVSMDVLEKYLDEAHFSYVAYTFSREHSNFIKTSFPSKILSVLKKQLPVLFHGPTCSTAYYFLEKFQAGLVLNTMEPEKIAESLAKISDNDFYKMQNECIRALSGEFNEKSIAKSWVAAITGLHKNN